MVPAIGDYLYGSDRGEPEKDLDLASKFEGVEAEKLRKALLTLYATGSGNFQAFARHLNKDLEEEHQRFRGFRRKMAIGFVILSLGIVFGLLDAYNNQARTSSLAKKNSMVIDSVCNSTAAIADLDRFFQPLIQKPPPHETKKDRRLRLQFKALIKRDLALIHNTEETCAIHGR